MTINLRNLRTFAGKRHDECDRMIARCLDELRIVLEAPDADVSELREMVIRTKVVRAIKLWEISVMLRAAKQAFLHVVLRVQP